MASSTDSNLVSQLYKLQAGGNKLIKSTLYDAPEDPSIKVRSWKMSEHHYYTVPSPFPTLARGLFTTRASDPGSSNKDETSGDAKHRIVARGYDKFFNMGEVPWNTWEAITTHTEPPYTVTVKSNGCIIFIAALTRNKLLITSKHAIGSGGSPEKSHSRVGEKWLNTHLASVGRSREDLAQVLWDNNWTAVAELCDDSFEEHVLAYSPEKTGLHLHGINHSSAEFVTLPSTSTSPEVVSVESFAKEWGFIPTVSLEMSSVAEVKKFSDECSSTGSWNGEPIEGFVVRTRIRGDPETRSNPDPNGSDATTDTNGKARDAPPYPPGSNFFFKVKYDEPYMMYRDWREITKAYLSAFDKNGRKGLEKSAASKHRLKRPETKVYDRWVREEIAKNSALFEGYQNNRGIVKTRQQFLQWFNGAEGQEAFHRLKRGSPSPTREQKVEGQKTIIVPVAIPGCGKTAVALALSKLFGFGHTQSDDVRTTGKKGRSASMFENNVMKCLESNATVIADKNNHLTRHRAALRQLLPNAQPSIKLIGLHWSTTSKSNAELHRICSERIIDRGENHQTLRPDTSDPQVHRTILWRFISTSEDLVEGELDTVIEMNLDDSLDQAVRRAVQELTKLMDLKQPTEDAIKKAVEFSQAYSIADDQRQIMKQTAREKTKKSPPRYFALIPEKFGQEDICSVIDGVISEPPTSGKPATENFKTMWSNMKSQNRVVDKPHITVVHKNGVETNEAPGLQKLWDECITARDGPLFEIALGHLVYNERIVALALERGSIASLNEGEQEQDKSFVRLIPDDILDRLHVTVGTRDSSVKPVEAKDLVLRWRRGKLVEGEGVMELNGKNTRKIASRLEGLWS